MGEEEGVGVRSGPGAARTILLFHTISDRPPKQPRRLNQVPLNNIISISVPLPGAPCVGGS